MAVSCRAVRDLQDLFRMAQSGELQTMRSRHFGAWRGLVFGVAAGTIAVQLRLFALTRSGHPTCRHAVDPSIAWVPLFILWFGFLKHRRSCDSGRGFLPSVLGVMGAVMSVDRKMSSRARLRLSGPPWSGVSCFQP